MESKKLPDVGKQLPRLPLEASGRREYRRGEKIGRGGAEGKKSGDASDEPRQRVTSERTISPRREGF